MGRCSRAFGEVEAIDVVARDPVELVDMVVAPEGGADRSRAVGGPVCCRSRDLHVDRQGRQFPDCGVGCLRHGEGAGPAAASRSVPRQCLLTPVTRSPSVHRQGVETEVQPVLVIVRWEQLSSAALSSRLDQPGPTLIVISRRITSASATGPMGSARAHQRPYSDGAPHRSTHAATSPFSSGGSSARDSSGTTA